MLLVKFTIDAPRRQLFLSPIYAIVSETIMRKEPCKAYTDIVFTFMHDEDAVQFIIISSQCVVGGSFGFTAVFRQRRQYNTR